MSSSMPNPCQDIKKIQIDSKKENPKTPYNQIKKRKKEKKRKYIPITYNKKRNKEEKTAKEKEKEKEKKGYQTSDVKRQTLNVGNPNR